MNNPCSLIPPRFHDLASRLGASFGINSDATSLMMMQAVGFAFGNTIEIGTPDQRRLGPAFNLALVSPGFSLPRGVFMALVQPISELLEKLKERRYQSGVPAIRAEFENTETQRHELLQTIANHEKTIEKEKALRDSMPAVLFRELGYEAKCADVETLLAELEKAKGTIAKNDAERDALLVTLGPEILEDEPPWRKVDSMATAAFDRTVLATRFENGAGGIGNLSGKKLELLMETLLRARLDASGVNMIVSDLEDAFAQALANRRIFENRVFQNFIFVEAGINASGPFALPDFGEGMDEWTSFVLDAFQRRVDGRKRHFQVDAEGYERLSEFHNWCCEQMQESTTDLAPFFMWWRSLCLRIAMTRNAMDTDPDEIVPAAYVNEAANFLMRLARRQFALLERMTCGNLEDEKQARVEQLVRKLRTRGPLTRRGIVRSFHKQDYGTVDALIASGVTEGRIEQRGNFFVPKDVSVSASAS